MLKVQALSIELYPLASFKGGVCTGLRFSVCSHVYVIRLGRKERGRNRRTGLEEKLSGNEKREKAGDVTRELRRTES